MPAFDAIDHSFSRLPSAGFSTNNAGIGHDHSPLINTIALGSVLLISGRNCGLHFR
ncbi:MAG: Trk system potassium uptake protein TrkH [Sodalis sp.]|nr:MAG: Trk system potassium uptake protein TrkH [Sodalis sp.]